MQNVFCPMLSTLGQQGNEDSLVPGLVHVVVNRILKVTSFCALHFWKNSHMEHHCNQLLQTTKLQLMLGPCFVWTMFCLDNVLLDEYLNVLDLLFCVCCHLVA